MAALMKYTKKGLASGQKHILPHVNEFGKSVLSDALEGRNVGSSIKTHMKNKAVRSLRKRH